MSRHGQLFQTQTQKDELEARNGRLQFRHLVFVFQQSADPLRITPDIIRDLHYFAIKDIYSCAGDYRTTRVRIAGSSHKPPAPQFVPGFVEEMCDSVSANPDWTPVKTASYLLWRLNWIHPFRGGNGRTSRAVAYLGMCIRFGFLTYGNPTIPELIVRERDAYRLALQDADQARLKYSVDDVGQMEDLMGRLIEEHLKAPDDLLSE